MIYVKSIGAGVLATMVAVLVAGAVLYAIYRPYGTRAVAFNPANLLTSARVWLLIAASFVLGFVWELRRALR
jgi:uncharacterized membrane protein